MAAIRWAEGSGLSTTGALSYPREREYLTLARVRIAQGQEQPIVLVKRRDKPDGFWSTGERSLF